MSIHIKAKAVVVHGIKMYEIKEIEALTRDELIEEYANGYPVIYQANRITLKLFSETGTGFHLSKGQKYLVPEMEDLLDIIRAAGDRLHDINARLAKENEGWEGTHYWVI